VSKTRFKINGTQENGEGMEVQGKGGQKREREEFIKII